MLIFGGGLLGLVAIVVWIFCVIDTLTTPESQVRNLPKLAWIFIVILLLDVGAILWLIAGRSWALAGQPGGSARTGPRRSPAPPRPGRWDPSGGGRPGRGVPANPDDDEDFLDSLRRRADEQRRRAQEKGDADGEVS